jgi:Zn-dependent protease
VVAYWERDVRLGVPKGTFRPSPIFMSFVAVFVAAGALAWLDKGNPDVNTFLFVVAGWMISLCLHEFGHALVALRAGDRGVIGRGYLQLDPRKYAHPFLSLILPLIFVLMGGIGLPGGAVMIDHSHVKNKRWDTFISLAGPLTNLIFTVLLLAPFLIGVNTAAHPVFWAAVAVLGFFQITATIINLLPVPGVDGGNAIYPWLSYDNRRGFDAVRPYGMLILLGCLFLPQVGGHVYDLFDSVLGAFGVPYDVFYNGYHAFFFWRN